MLISNTNLTPNNRNAPKTAEELQSKAEWKFWDTQPVPQLDAQIPAGVNEPIQADLSIDDIKSDSFSLPDGFKWVELDLDNKDELSELYTLLYDNYVEDDDNMFRFDYSSDFLKW